MLILFIECSIDISAGVNKRVECSIDISFSVNGGMPVCMIRLLSVRLTLVPVCMEECRCVNATINEC